MEHSITLQDLGTSLSGISIPPMPPPVIIHTHTHTHIYIYTLSPLLGPSPIAIFLTILFHECEDTRISPRRYLIGNMRSATYILPSPYEVCPPAVSFYLL
ncbi:hypothetical protein I7I53_07617 [Histoplasma capsulatum var. duboisii H88]|uniref:Uncharacterized protein n=1 Tax=Ajellomyces capsulatus (strain H88) TaxID=544711 RepID=A0A8A1LGP3_AJEC8|nr:hypothetical protein I7I53_07617 [Histoplasma capsulatum var. duboisii H88]